MKTSLSYKLFTIFFLALAANGLLGYAVYKVDQAVLDSEQWVNHTNDVIKSSAGLLSISKEMETASTGFIITGDKSFRDPLYNAQKTIFISLRRLRKLTADNPAQQKRIDSLDIYMQGYVGFSLKTIEQRNGLATAFTSAKQGKLYADHILYITRAIQQDESRLLIKRKQINNRNEALFHNITFVILILFAGVTILLILFIRKYVLQGKEKEAKATELVTANKKLSFQYMEKEKRAAELVIANEELFFQNAEKEKRAAELVIANKELSFQNDEKEKRAAELAIANKELSFQNDEKEKRAAELVIVNKKLLFQNTEKEKRAAELAVANKELSFQNAEKEKRAAELFIANKELFFQNTEKEKRAAELVVANKELFFQNKEKGNRASELSIANKELSFQNNEKESRAAELAIANEELFFQNTEKEKRANELIIANLELLFQNQEKESRAAELAVANQELSYQNEEKEKRAAELKKANRLYAFISEVNQNILREKAESGLFRRACAIAHDFGKFKIAWIGLFNDNYNDITQIAQIGIPDNAMAQFNNIPLLPGGPQNHVLLTGEYFVCNDILNESELKNWRVLAVKQGINSCIILPIKKSGEIIGTFNLYVTEINFFNQDEIALLVDVTGEISFALDMFEREKVLRQTQDLVIENEKRFHALIEKSTDIITLGKPTGEFIYASRSITRILGYSVKELVQLSVFDIVHPDDMPYLMQNQYKILKRPGQTFYYQQRRKHKNGEWIWCEGSLTNMMDEPGIHALVSNFRDVSEKKAAEIQQEYDRNNMDALINNSNDLMWSVDTNFKMITSNKPFDNSVAQYTGKRVKKGGDILKISATNDQLNLYKNFYQRAFSGETFTEIIYNNFPFDTWSEISFYPIRNADEVIGTACHSHDITERKQGEIDRKNLVNDLLLRNTELEQFAYVASHDLQEPLRMITSFMTQLEKKYSAVVDDKGRKYIHFAVDGAKRMRQIILDLLEFSRVGKTEDDLEEVDFNKLINEVLALYRRQIEEVKAHLIFKNLPNIKTYKTPLRQVFQNLIGNSLKYHNTGTAPLIKIGCTETETYFQFSVSDNGIGIAPEYAEKIFIIFQRLHNKDDYSGTGMGLAIVKKIIESLGGKIWVESAEGKGATFYFTIMKTPTL